MPLPRSGSRHDPTGLNVYVGFVTESPCWWTIGGILLVIGVILWILGTTGRAVGGRKHYY
ncbi:MAG TPA: DUF6131 family protein [Kineosporiaceae bacterium]|nr:DUF6131 family protein [Kineosporiaceae bacterium]